MTILIIEDQVDQLKLASLVLSYDGHNVSQADSAWAAFEKIKSERPDVILLDLCLPVIDGLLLARSLKSDPATRDIRIVGITSYYNRYSKKSALEAGCDAYLTKPLDTRRLSQQLQLTRHAFSGS